MMYLCGHNYGFVYFVNPSVIAFSYMLLLIMKNIIVRYIKKILGKYALVHCKHKYCVTYTLRYEYTCTTLYVYIYMILTLHNYDHFIKNSVNIFLLLIKYSYVHCMITNIIIIIA